MIHMIEIIRATFHAISRRKRQNTKHQYSSENKNDVSARKIQGILKFFDFLF